MNVQKYIEQCQKRVHSALIKRLPPSTKQPKYLHKAMRYAALSGGKRLRSSLVYATGEALGAKYNILDDMSAAIEMIHAFSLIHDDLPALDNDSLRRGKPTCHKAFGEATAILAGDALHTLAFETLSNLNEKIILPKMKIEIIRLLACATGSNGLIGGEELDLKMAGGSTTLKKLETMYQMKTGVLLTASILFGALAANCQNKQILRNLTKFSECIGLAFQIHDDIIGIESDTKTLGKQQGADVALKKPVYPLFVGMKRAKQKRELLFTQAIAYLDETKLKTDKLKGIASYIIERNY